MRASARCSTVILLAKSLTVGAPVRRAILKMGAFACALLGLGATFASQTASRQDVAHHLERRAGGWSQEQVEVLTDVVYEHAYVHRLDPELVLAVMAVESSFRLDARSSVGAVGLMQVMPGTGQRHASKAGVRWRGTGTLYDPVANIRIGTSYLAWLVQEFDGDIPLALSAYNQGIGRVRRDLARQGNLSERQLRYSRKVLRQWTDLQQARGRPAYTAAPAPVPEVEAREVEARDPWWKRSGRRRLFRRSYRAVSSL